MEMELKEGIASKIAIPQGRRDIWVWDTKTPGLFLRKFVSGRAIYGVRYSAGGRDRRMHLRDAGAKGSLAKARSEAEDVRAGARLGTDTLADRQAAAEAARRSISLKDIAERYLKDRKPAWRPRYYLEIERHLMGTKFRDGKERTPAAWKSLHGLGITAIRRADIVKVLDELAEDRGRVEADRARSALSGLYTWAIDRGYCDATPVMKIKPRAVANGGRERTLTPEELREVWHATHAVNESYGRIVRLLILTGQRRDEVGSLRWAEVQENGEGAKIDLPGERTKNHRGHIVPLSRQAIDCLPPKPNEPHPFVFGRRQTAGFSGWSKAKGQLDAHVAAQRLERGVKDAMAPWVLHDLRRTFVTMVGELGIAPPHVVEAIVNHVSGHKAGVAGTYNKALYLEERRRALVAWGEWVAALVASQSA